MTDSYEIMNSVSEWLNIIEMKKFVDDGLFLQMKITHYHLSEIEYFYYKNKGWLHPKKSGSNTLPLRNRSDFNRCLLWNDYIGKIPGGLLKNSESQGGGNQSLENEQGDPLLMELWRKPPKVAFMNSIYFVTDGSWTTISRRKRTLHLVLRMRGETEQQDARHQWQRDHQDPEHFPHSAQEH